MADEKQADRSITLVRDPKQDGIGVIRIRVGKKYWYYTIHEIRCEIGGRGFAIHRLGLGELYHVRVGKLRDCSCECLGYLYRGKCRHILGLLALIRQGKL